LKIEQFEETIDGVVRGEVERCRIVEDEAFGGLVELGDDPFHLRAIGCRLIGDDDVDGVAFVEDAFEPAQHVIGAAEDGVAKVRVGLVQPCGEADAAGDGVEFRDGEAVFSEEQVGTYDARPFVFEGWMTLEFDEGTGFAQVEPLSDPGGLFAGHALSVEQIDRAIELEQDAAERFEFAEDGGLEREWGRSDAPVLMGEEAAGRQAIADGGGSLSGVQGSEVGSGCEMRIRLWVCGAVLLAWARAHEVSGSDLAGADADPFVGGELIEAHGAAGADFVGADADFGAHAELSAVGEPG
jgi:hypothetical protein